jgi:methylthioribose-1-phosphate isomerase
MAFVTLEYGEGRLRLLDQRRLPLEETYLECRTADEVWTAIRDMVVRGAPALAIAAAYGLCIAARSLDSTPPESRKAQWDRLCDWMGGVRPTAVNLSWAVERMRRAGHAAPTREPAVFMEAVESEARRIQAEDLAANHAIGAHGAALIADGSSLLTHCNAGALATSGYGTALGVIRAAHASGKRIRVLAGETRPFLQGARLTAWELMQDGIDVTLITDNMSAHMMKKGGIHNVIVGADRIAANGDTANKIGTYAVAILARHHGIPLYVAAPMSTVDLACPNGEAIPIEQRPPSEVTDWGGRRIAPQGVGVANPAFDVTPADLIAAIITERGIARPPYAASLRALASSA